MFFSGIKKGSDDKYYELKYHKKGGREGLTHGKPPSFCLWGWNQPKERRPCRIDSGCPVVFWMLRCCFKYFLLKSNPLLSFNIL